MVFSEMVSAKGLIHENRATKRYLRTCAEEYPLSVQLFGGDPESLAEAAQLVAEEGIPAIDINMGCPVRKVLKGRAGAALLQDLPRAEKILTAVRKAVPLVLTIKIRSGWDGSSINCREMARMAEGCGVDALTLHPRTARQLFTGSADWNKIKEVKETVSIPVIGNGDVTCYQDVLRMEEETGCDGVMIGRAALGNPWIFDQVLSAREGAVPQTPAPQMKLVAILTHIDLMADLYPEEVGVSRFKAHVLHYLKGIHGVKAVRRQVCSQVHGVEELRERIKEFFDNYGRDRAEEEIAGAAGRIG